MVRQWTAEEIEAVQAAALADWDAGKVGKEFSEKQLGRDVSNLDIERTLRSKSSLICRYTHHARPRFGFWHPRVKVWMAWQPPEKGLRSEWKTCIPDIKNGLAYGQHRDDFELVRMAKG